MKITVKTEGRRPLTISATALITEGELGPDQTFPFLIRPAVKRLDLTAWASSNREFVNNRLFQYGAILFRDFSISSLNEFENFVKAVSGEPLEYKERTSPRSRLVGNIYTSTDYPADQSIFLHNENSYQHEWPMKIFFFCVTPPKEGGETPIADCRRVLKRVEPSIVKRFIQEKWMYVRNYAHGMGMPWQTAFQTENKAQVEEYCRNAGIEFEWKEHDRLKTCQVRPPVMKHPVTGEIVWFNHIAFFHVSTLEAEFRQALIANYGEGEIPNNTYYGNGDPIEAAVVENIREAYLKETVSFPWQKGDILMLDNMLAAHSRRPFTGNRQIVVAMSELLRGA